VHIDRQAVDTDNNFQIFVDRVVVRSGSLLKDFDPPVNPNEFMVRLRAFSGQRAGQYETAHFIEYNWSAVPF
jgi:hypothetical protein